MEPDSRQAAHPSLGRTAAIGVAAIAASFGLAIGVAHLSWNDDLDEETQIRIGTAWERLFVFCNVSRNASASDEREAREALQAILNQYAVTPDGRTAFSVSADLRPMRVVLESVAYRVTADHAQCRGLQRTAMRALSR